MIFSIITGKEASSDSKKWKKAAAAEKLKFEISKVLSGKVGPEVNNILTNIQENSLEAVLSVKAAAPKGLTSQQEADLLKSLIMDKAV